MAAISNISLVDAQAGNEILQKFNGPLVHSAIRRILTNQLYDVSMGAFQAGDTDMAPGMVYVLEAGADSKLEIQRKHSCQGSFDRFIEELIVF